MAAWSDVTSSAASFAQAVEEHFGRHRHHVLATLRRDGSPRVSGIEVTFGGGHLWLGMMPSSRKAADLRRDPRMALHSASVDPDETSGAWAGDAKLSGRAVEVAGEEERRAATAAIGDDARGADLFRIEVSEVLLVRVGEPADHLVLSLWRDGTVREFRRS